MIKHTIWAGAFVLLLSFYDQAVTECIQTVPGMVFWNFCSVVLLRKTGLEESIAVQRRQNYRRKPFYDPDSTKDRVKEVIDKIESNNYSGIILSGLVLMDDKDNTMTGKEIEGIKVVADLGHISEYIQESWVDEVFNLPGGQ